MARIAVTVLFQLALLVNQLAQFKTIEAAPGASFTIPAADISERWDLMYYFEVLNADGGGWFQPDPLRETPYYVLRVVTR